jgi:hypothetical protein
VAGLIPCIVALSILCCLPVEGLEEVQADRILVRKAARELVLYRQGKVLKSYRVALGRNPVDPKRRQGDRKTPEGRYTITGRNPSCASPTRVRRTAPARAAKESVREATS